MRPSEPQQFELIQMAAARNRSPLGFRNSAEQKLAVKALMKGWTPIHHGWPDFICFGPDGSVVVVECKPRNKRGELQSLKPQQILIMNWLKSLGVHCYVSDGETLEPYGGIAVHGRSSSTERVRRYRKKRREAALPETLHETPLQEGEPLGGDGYGLKVLPVPGNERRGTNPPKVPVETPDVTPAELQEFRWFYPPTSRTSWVKAEKRFMALSKKDQAAAVAGARKLFANPPEPQFRKAADGWLLDRRWETVGDTPRTATKFEHNMKVVSATKPTEVPNNTSHWVPTGEPNEWKLLMLQL